MAVVSPPTVSDYARLLARSDGMVVLEMSREEFDALDVEWKRLEWYDGLCVMTGATVHHEALARSLFLLLHGHTPDGYEAVYEVRWGPAKGAFVPDLALVRLSESRARQRELRTPPLLGVEVLSTSTRLVDLHRKRELYARGGLEWYWIADGDRHTLTVLRLVDGDLVEVQRIEGRGRTAGPVELDVDFAAMSTTAEPPAGEGEGPGR